MQQSPPSRRPLLVLGPLPPFDLPLVPAHLNERLTTYFLATEVRQRFYQFLLALLRHHSLRSANAVAFDLFLALVPLLALAGWAIGHVLATDWDATLTSSVLLDVTPYQFRSFIRQNLAALSAETLAPLAAAAGWWLSSSAFSTLISVFEESFECVPRPYWQTTAISMGFAFATFCLLALGGAGGVFFTLGHLGHLDSLVQTLRGSGLIQASVLLGTVLVLSSYIAFIYRYAVRRALPRRRVWPGALFAALTGSAASLGFAVYASHVPSYALFYGGLAIVAILLLWLWLWCTALLIGAELNVALEDMALIRKHHNEHSSAGDAHGELDEPVDASLEAEIEASPEGDSRA